MPGGRFALRDFVLVMREREIDAAGVNIERVAQIFHGHRRAFHVPAGTSRADSRLPEMLSRLWRLPQGEITGIVLFVLVDVDARARFHSVHVDFRKLSVVGELRDAEIDGAVARVGKPFLLELLDQRDHVLNVIGRADKLFRHFDIERARVFEKRANIFLRVFADAHAGACGVLDDAVVHVGNVHHLQHAIALRMQEAPQHVLKHERAKIPDMREGINRRPAGVNADFTPVERLERLQAVRSSCCAALSESFLGRVQNGYSI